MKDPRLYGLEQATARVAAAAEAARKLPFPFVLTARAENFLRGAPDLPETIARLQAYERAGADVLFAPGLPDLESVRAVCSALRKPVNFMVGLRDRSFSVHELELAGVMNQLGRIADRFAMNAVATAAREVLQAGTFSYVARS